MSSTNKTSLGLNMWEASDKPVRQDFINDNKIIDERIAKLNSDLTGKVNNSDLANVQNTVTNRVYANKASMVDMNTAYNVYIRQNHARCLIIVSGVWGKTDPIYAVAPVTWADATTTLTALSVTRLAGSDVNNVVSVLYQLQSDGSIRVAVGSNSYAMREINIAFSDPGITII